jgi:ribokinase
MPALYLGSCCIDPAYSMPHPAAPGETLHCSNHQVCPDGKDLNQSIAMAAAGAKFSQAGKVGQDGRLLLNLMASRNIDADPTGHAKIQFHLKVRTRLYCLTALTEPS